MYSPIRSNLALHRASDRVCLEHGLSIIAPGKKEMKRLQISLDNSSRRNRSAQKNCKQEPGFSLLIDIQAKLQEGKGRGYEIWAKRFNLKQMAQVMCFLEENGIGSYEENVQFAELAAEKKSLYAEYREERKRKREYLIAEKNVATILELDDKNENSGRRQEDRKSNRNDLER